MVKKRLNLTVDEDIYNAARNKVDNFSKSFERYLNSINNSTEDNLESLRLKLVAEENKLDNAMKNIAILQAELRNKMKLSENIEDNKEIIWTKFRIELQKRKYDKCYDFMNENIVIEAENTLGYPKDILIQMDTFVRHNYQTFDCSKEFINKWKYIEPEWRKYNDKLL